MSGNENQIFGPLSSEQQLGPDFLFNYEKAEQKDEKFLSIPREKEHLNPFYLYLLAEIPRFQAGEFFKFSSEYHENIIKKTRQDPSTPLKNLFSLISEKKNRDIFMVGPFSKVSTYISEVSDEKGAKVLGENYRLEWLALCPNPYLGASITDEFPQYDGYREFPKSRWLETPTGDNSLTEDTLRWIEKASQNDKLRREVSFYLGNDRLQPDYSRERFLEDYRGILVSIMMTEQDGFSLFELLWPVNDYASGLIGLVSLFYQSVYYRKQVDVAPDNPLLLIFGFQRRAYSAELMSVLMDPANFERVISLTRTLHSKHFTPYLESQRKSLESRILELRSKKFL